MRLRQIGKAHCSKRAFKLLLRGAPALMLGRIRHICYALLVAGFLSPSPAQAGGETAAFLAAIEDVPLMAGLTEDTAATLDFDKPDGRLVEVFAYGEVGRDDVVEFYITVMPEFGWQLANDLVFSRDGEMLRIHLSTEDRLLLVRFVLSPHSSQ